MLTDELIRLAATQPEIRETRRVRVWGPQLRALVESGKLRRLDEIVEHADQTSELKTFRYGHILGAAITRTDLAEWQARFPAHPLPADLAEFLLRVDGVHVWADLDEGRAYFGIAPLAEWEDAATVGWSALFERRPVGVLVISYHQNGDYYAVLDTATSIYWWYDLEDFDHPRVIGTALDEVLDWLWKKAAELRPSLSRAD
jgi:hypothetical protein